MVKKLNWGKMLYYIVIGTSITIEVPIYIFEVEVDLFS